MLRKALLPLALISLIGTSAPAWSAAVPPCLELASMLTRKSSERGGLPFHSALAESRLDYSMNSLKAIDAWLDVLHREHDKLPATEYINAVMWTGCYVGEVLRRADSSRAYRWMAYDEYVAANPAARLLLPKQTVENSFLLVAGDKAGRFTLPLSRVSRYIFEGPTNAMQPYVAGEIQRPN